MPGPHLLFPGKASFHGELHGGLIGPDKDTPHRASGLLALDEAYAYGVLVTARALVLPANVDFSTQAWWNIALSADDQGNLGSCVSFAADHARRVLSLQIGHQDQKHSQLWIYHEMQRKFLPAQVGQDTGAYGAWAQVIIEGRGFALESDWPYHDNTTALANAPTPASYGRALWYKNVVTVAAGIDVSSLKQLLVAGHGFMCGLAVYQSWYEAQGNGNVPVPPAGDQQIGGHELYVFGYQDDPKYAGGGYFRVLNQWGSGPGTWFSPRNFLQIPYDYWTKGYAMDSTCLARVPANPTPEAGR